ncbi:hypothetical protein HanIR_Chr06g0279741 [Helianthus annuus]|nr:hypothetical protein HanIR_Chr06g0279741 [Helianthus annuus]
MEGVKVNKLMVYVSEFMQGGFFCVCVAGRDLYYYYDCKTSVATLWQHLSLTNFIQKPIKNYTIWGG